MTYFYDPCEPCCAEEEQTEECAECPDGMSVCWELTVAGITNDVCAECDEMNGTFILSWVSGCIFESPNEGALEACMGSSAIRWSFVINVFGQLTLSANGGIATYATAGGGDVNCNDTNEVPFISSSTACQNWPATLTLEPIACP